VRPLPVEVSSAWASAARGAVDTMKDFFISDCAQQENKVITSTFVVVSKQVKPKAANRIWR
jgi:hypothetical protein